MNCLRMKHRLVTSNLSLVAGDLQRSSPSVSQSPATSYQLPVTSLLVLLFVANVSAGPLGPMLSGTFAGIDSGSVVDLSSEGAIDWVHWGLYTETSLDRKAGVALQISDFALLDSPTGFAYVYQLSDNVIGYSWNDGTPTAVLTNTTTGVWAYGTPQTGSGFQISAPADTDSRTLKVYVGGYGADGTLEAFLTDASAPGYTNTS